jgi:hypothetical protein
VLLAGAAVSFAAVPRGLWIGATVPDRG